jgi:hypothetical protein
MMSRTARVLKWTVAVTVLLAAAPIAYAEPVPSSTPAQAQGTSAGCGAAAADFAGAYGVVNSSDQEYDFNTATMTVGLSYFGQAAASGTWRAGGGAFGFTVGGVTYAAKPAGAVCGDPAAAGRVTSLVVTSADGSGTLTLSRR